MTAAILTAAEYTQGVLARDPVILSRAVTLVESSLERHRATAQEVMESILPHTGKSIRIGITGVPGAGKSTFIETFGMTVCEKKHRIAVLAIDPSSSVTGGSILGDKTRMAELSTHPNAFIRPSPSSGALGGVARKTRETMLLCEAAGYDVIVVETVGVGQSEVTVRSLVDFFLLLMITGAGDELQGLKKGIIELADAIVINKADGENEGRAVQLKSEFNQLLGFIGKSTKGWTTRAHTCSAKTGHGIEEVWQVIVQFRESMQESGALQSRRGEQLLAWMESLISDGIRERFLGKPHVRSCYTETKQALAAGSLSATAAAERVLSLLDKP